MSPQRSNGFSDAESDTRTWCAQLRETVRTSLNPRTESEARIVSAQLSMISDASRHHALLLQVIGGVIALAFISSTPWPRILLWWGAVVVAFGGAFLAGRYAPPPRQDASALKVSRAAWGFTIVNSILAVVWCAMMPVLWVHGNTFGQIVLVLVITSSMASSASINAPHFVSGQIALLIYGLTISVIPGLMEGHFNLFFVLMAVVFWISMEFQAHSHYRTAHKMFVLQDERLELIEGLQQAKDESDIARDLAEKASQAKSQFLANMSHELRTPLNAILGFSEMIHSGIGGSQPGRHAEYAKLVHESGHHLLALINDILDLSKIEAGGLDLDETEVDLKSLIEDCVRLMDAKAELGGIVLRCDLAADLPPIRADERAMRQILLNLLSNALKFTPPGGDVAVFMHVERDGTHVFGVSDTGVGIAEDDQLRAFEKFGQGRHDIVTMDKGTGLGLSIVKGLVAIHGGSIALTSRIGEGTCVRISLPADRRCPPRAMRATP